MNLDQEYKTIYKYIYIYNIHYNINIMCKNVYKISYIYLIICICNNIETNLLTYDIINFKD